jgi:isoleucyl-tRNA synthetase
VNWCIECGSALAEAEVEYEDRTSPAIDVAFRAADPAAVARAFGAKQAPAAASAVIWTTTPWTLPGNRAIAAHPEFDYELVATAAGALIVVSELREACLARWGLVAESVLGRAKGAALEGLAFRHPFEPRDVPMVLGTYVALDAGTGLVHTAPAHGADDFETGVRYGLPLDQPVDDTGHYKPTVAHFAGLAVRKAEKPVLDLLQASGALLRNEPFRHSYPHCWRHKTPIIFRATTQWFIAMDRKGAEGPTLRELARKAIDETKFYPAWGKARIESMITTRPDWTLSRQRNWGVPLTFFLHRETEAPHPDSEALFEKAAAKVEKGGIEAWFAASCEDFGVDAAAYRKVNDTVDVWFDSGTTHASVLRGLPGQRWPADLYLEGSDQHRGWFQSSLLTGCALDGRAPYGALLTHGMTVDAQGRKMSKSLGNVDPPQKVAGTLGAEIIRLWVAATDYSGELSISDEILKRVVESYRRIRNTLRFLLANTSDFDAAKHSLPVAEWVEIDRYALALTRKLVADCAADYSRFEFHLVTQRLQAFCSEDLGGFWLDILKDRLYTTGANSRARRSAQSALHHVTQALLRLMAPILSFTAEEAWAVLHPRREESIFFHTWKDLLPEPAGEAELLERWGRIREIRVQAQRALEELRQSGGIGSSLQAEAVVVAPEADRALLQALGEDLRFVLITSTARIEPGEALAVKVAASPHAKCGRCWHFRADVGSDPAHATICARCVSNLEGPGEERRHA